ncbi:PAS domain-containing protein, partial [bacterium]|nr:PAS domain-containing protein [bacterium]
FLIARSRLQGLMRRVFTYSAISWAAFAVGAVYRSYVIFRTGMGPPFGSLEDVGLLTGFLFMIPLVLNLGSSGTAKGRRLLGTYLDLAAMTTLGFGLVVLLLSWMARGQTWPVASRLGLGAYLASSLGYALYPPFFRTEAWTRWARTVYAGLVLGPLVLWFMVLSSALGLRIYQASAVYTVLVDSLFVIMCVLLSIAAAMRGAGSGSEDVPAPAEDVPKWPVVVVAFSMGIGLPLLIIGARTPQALPVQPWLVGTAALATVVVVFRSGLTLAEARWSGGATEAQERYRTLVESAPTSIMVADADGLILYANPAAADILDASSPADLLGRDIGEFISDETKSAQWYRQFAASLTRSGAVVRAHEPLAAGQWVLLTTTGRRIEVGATVSAITYAGGVAYL